jgi:hypothetical protein
MNLRENVCCFEHSLSFISEVTSLPEEKFRSDLHSFSRVLTD